MLKKIEYGIDENKISEAIVRYFAYDEYRNEFPADCEDEGEALYRADMRDKLWSEFYDAAKNITNPYNNAIPSLIYGCNRHCLNEKNIYDAIIALGLNCTFVEEEIDNE